MFPRTGFPRNWAATFGALAVIPLLFLAQIALIVAFGVLPDTLFVRSLLVSA